MYHSLIIDEKNTYDDFGLIPTSRPVITPPSPRLSYIEVPGMSGVLDTSASLTGHISYENRTGSIEFLVPREKNWSEVYSELLFYLQGRYARLVLEDDPSYYYEGRLSISAWKSNKNNSTIILDYDLSPFKYETKNTTDGYLISERNLSGNVYYYADEYTKALELIVDCESLTGSGVKVYIDGIAYQCYEGVNLLPVLQCEGSGSIRLSGTGKITVKYRKGRL